MIDTASAHSEASDFFTLWAKTLAQVLGEISGAPIACMILTDAPAESESPASTDLWIGGAFSGPIRGEMSMRIPANSASHLARVFVGEPASGEPEPVSESREAIIELLRQVGGLVVTPLRRDFGDVQLHVDASSTPPSWQPSSATWLRIGEPQAGAAIQIQVSAALAAALHDLKPDARSSPEGPQAAKSALPDPVKLDLLMDVELAVTLRFGSRRMLLREILELTAGSVVELDRQIHEPIDMLLDGRVIARGEIVVLDGNYGLQVTEVGPTE
ncbi:MAG TPA: flagellar motor switch protein FliN [Candidatus Acidoferrales bacterium]|nr:flagellar motor switch protein FliN [Candidatus Acidoferrales bacterium]